MRLALAAVVTLFFAACGHVIPGSLTADGKPFDFAQPGRCEPSAPDDAKVDVRYLGSGGVWIGWRGEAILIGPSFSNPPLWRAAVWRAGFDQHRITRALAPLDLGRVRAVLAGHSHYDHIGDFPVVARTRELAGVPIHVNAAGLQMLRAEPDLFARAHEITDKKLITVSDAIHVRAVRSSHAPQLCPWRRFPCVYASGPVREPWPEKSWTRHLLRSFKGGETFAFVIELLEAGEVRYRIYYTDSSPDSPTSPVDGDVDLAILVMAQWKWARGYPNDLLAALHPRHVVVSHWDNFFRKDENGSRFVPNLSNGSAEQFLAVINEKVSDDAGPTNRVCGVRSQRWTMPVVGASMQFDTQKPPSGGQ